MLYIIALLPILLYLLAIKTMDGFSLASWKKIAECAAWGLVCCITLYFISAFTFWQPGKAAPLIEELLKAFPLIWTVFRKRSAFFAEALIYGTAIGAGFSFAENILYVLGSIQFTWGDALVRGFGTALLHMGCTALYATLAIVVARMVSRMAGPVQCALCYLSVLPSFAIHSIYNMFLLPEIVQMLLIIIVIMALFLLIYQIDSNLIHKWLDSCINNDIALLAAIREGKLKNTAAGEYLIQMREKFQPEVFFDICVYLGLYLEMSINAKSRMILKEAEMDIPIDEATHKENLEKIKEIKALRKSIGLSGMMVLEPIISQKAADEWTLNELL